MIGLILVLINKPFEFRMKPNEIRSLLILKGVRQRKIARELGITPQTVCCVIAGKTRSRRVREAIAKAIGKSYLEVWNGEDAA